MMAVGSTRSSFCSLAIVMNQSFTPYMPFQKGSSLHEVVNLPGYWRALRGVDHPVYERKQLRYGAHPRQYVELVMPMGREPRAWMVYWHGGGWRFGKPERFLPAAFPWLEMDVAVALPSYRRVPRFRWDSIEMDLVNSLRAIQHEVGLRAGREAPFVLAGLSAGGHVAATVGLRPELLEQSGWHPEQLRGVISCAGVLSMDEMPYFPVHWALAGRDHTLRRLFDPVALIHPSAPPFYLLHGPHDGLAPYRGALRFHDRFHTVAPGRCELHELPGGTHLDAGRWATVDVRTRRRLQEVVATWLSNR